jgi:regulator of RNase E activity RraA
MRFRSELEMFAFMEREFYSGAISDILDEMGFTECAASPHALIRPLFPQAVCAGRVRTLINAPRRTGREDPYKMAIALMDSLRPGDVAVATAKKPLETGIMGELSATAMRSRGARGCLVDGYTRDARKIIRMRFPVFARGVSPIDTTDRAAVVEIDCQVVFANRRVEPGMIVFADLDGIVFIPREVEKEAIREAIRRVRAESKVRRALGAGRKVREVWDKYRVM